jgi:hypothetical protein
MAEVQHTPEAHPAVKGFMGKDLAGLPVWVWLLIVAGGVAVAFILPKFLNKSATPSVPDSGLGLAVDPTTGLPYAVSGLVPSGGTVGTTQDVGTPTNNTPLGLPIIQPNPTINNTLTINPGSIPVGSRVWGGGGGRWWTDVNGTQYLINLPPNSSVEQGSQGRWWYTPPGGQQTQLTGVSSPPAPIGDSNSHGGPMEVYPQWPGGTSQVRMV